MKKVVLFLFCFVFIGRVYASKIELTDIECVDGDTLRAKIDGEIETVRFLAVDTPETKYSTKDKDEPYAVEASEFVCNKLTDAKKVELEYDEKSNKTDKYGRVLGWIFVDDKLLQKDLVGKGYAKVEYVYDNYLYADELKEEEEKAKTNKIGIWSENKEDNIINIDENDDDKSVFDKIVDYVWEKLKELFKYLYKTIKNFIKNDLKNYF